MLCSIWDLSSQTRDQTLAPALEALSLKHWTTREAPAGYTSKNGIDESFGNSLFYIFNLLINLFNHLVTLCLICRTFPKWLYHFTFPLKVYESFIYFTSLSILHVICLSEYKHPSDCEMIYSCDFDLPLPNGK